MVAAAVVGSVAALAALAVGVLSPIIGVLVGFLVALVLVVVLAAIRAVFAFAPVAVVVDDAGVFESLSNTVGFVRSRPIGAAFYYVISVGSLLAVSTVSSILVLVEIFVLTTVVITVALLPALGLLKTALYARYRDRLAPPAMPERSVRRQFRDGLRRLARDDDVRPGDAGHPRGRRRPRSRLVRGRLDRRRAIRGCRRGVDPRPTRGDHPAGVRTRAVRQQLVRRDHDGLQRCRLRDPGDRLVAVQRRLHGDRRPARGRPSRCSRS